MQTSILRCLNGRISSLAVTLSTIKYLNWQVMPTSMRTLSLCLGSRSLKKPIDLRYHPQWIAINLRQRVRPVSRRSHDSKLTYQQRYYARVPSPDTNTKPSVHDSNPIVLPGSQSQTKTAPAPQAPGAVPQTPSAKTTPPRSGPISTSPPEQVPLVPTPDGVGKVQTAPPASNPPTRQTPPTSATTPESPPSILPKRRPRWRRFFLTLFLLSGLSYAGGVYYSLVSDNFHDFFTEYIPYGEDAVFFFEERVPKTIPHPHESHPAYRSRHIASYYHTKQKWVDMEGPRG